MKIIAKLISLSLVTLFVAGCGEVIRHKALIPQDIEGWKTTTYYFDDSKKVGFKCGEMMVEVSEVTLEENQYIVGPLIPLIPNWYHFDHRTKNPLVDITVSTSPPNNDPLFGPTGVILRLPDSTILEPVKYNFISKAYYDPSSAYYYTFDRDRSEVTEFTIVFRGLESVCELPPLVYRLEDVTKYRLVPPRGLFER